MKRILLGAALVAVPFVARADDPPTVMLPTSLVTAEIQYLATRPYAEVAQFIDAMRGCINVQIPHNGAIVSHGECPAVTQAMADQQKAQADAAKEALVPPSLKQKPTEAPPAPAH